MKRWQRWSALSIAGLIRVACVLALLGLSSMAYSVLVPRPLPVIWAMSAGHSFGALAFLCYLLAVIIDAARTRNTSVTQSSKQQ